jgi:tetratricopeptide (TPR) repeat protein
MTLAQGTRLGPYEIQAPIGAGGMGEVYRATDTRLGRTVALKVLPAGMAKDTERRRRFEQEARAASAINHPHICVLHDIGSQDGIDFLVMEYLEGRTLAQHIACGPLPLAEALMYGSQIAEALDSAHGRGVIHRDLKPGNVILTGTGAKLLDFGLAKLKIAGAPGTSWSSALTTEASPLSTSGTILGTLGYMAPEQVEGKEADARSDLFAFGAVLYEMLTGKRAFAGTSPASVIAAILDREPPPVSTLLPASPPSLDRLLQRCLAKSPAERWESAHDIADELRRIGNTIAGKGTDAEPASPGSVGCIGGIAETSAQSRRRRWWLAAVMIVIAAVLGWFALSRWTQPALAFKERDFVLAADVENGTGEAVFDLALKSALEISLRQSRYVNVLDSNQVQNALRMMRMKADTRVTLEVGRKMLAQALQEDGSVSERENLHLRALNKQFVKEDLQGALDDYRFISELYPDLVAPYNNSGQILEKLGRFREAVSMYEKAHKADPRNPFPLVNLWWLAIQRMKDPALAEPAARTLVDAAGKIRSRKEPIVPDLEGMTGCLLAAAGRREEARSLAESLARKAAGSVDINYELARVWALLGDKKRALHFLDEAFAAGYQDPYMILIDPSLASVRDDPAFDRLAPYRAMSRWPARASRGLQGTPGGMLP